MINDFSNACLNVLLFVPFGFFLPVLWKEFRNAKKVFIAGFAMTSFIEIAQIFTGRTTDINDIITNIAVTLIGYLIAYWRSEVYRYFYKKNSEKFKKERLLHNMCICSTYYVLPSTIYFIFVMGNDSVTSNFTLRSIETVKFTIFYVAWV